jgi:hypothetical protein
MQVFGYKEGGRPDLFSSLFYGVVSGVAFVSFLSCT